MKIKTRFKVLRIFQLSVLLVVIPRLLLFSNFQLAGVYLPDILKPGLKRDRGGEGPTHLRPVRDDSFVFVIRSGACFPCQSIDTTFIWLVYLFSGFSLFIVVCNAKVQAASDRQGKIPPLI